VKGAGLQRMKLPPDIASTPLRLHSGGAILKALLQLRVLGFGFLQDGDVGIGVFPEREEILIGAL
jgi:hypothetical protein